MGWDGAEEDGVRKDVKLLLLPSSDEFTPSNLQYFGEILFAKIN